MRIGVMLRHLDEKGGIVVYTANLLEALLALGTGDEYHLLYRSPELLGRFGRSEAVREVVLPGRSRLWWDQVSVPAYARRAGLDLVFQPKLSVPLRAPCPTVFALHGAEFFALPHVFPWHNRLYNRVMMPLYFRRAHAMILAARTGCEDAVRLGGAPAAKLKFIPLAAHPRFRRASEDEVRAIRARRGLPDRYLLFVGGINPLKNVGNLLRAFAALRDRIPHALVIVGFDRWKHEADRGLVEGLHLEDRVLFPGFLPDEELPAVYSGADVLLLPSLYEGFGIPVVEAMACGCPVVTTKTGASPEVAGGAAELVNPFDPGSIAAGILRVLTDDDRRKDMVRRGLARAAEFSWERTARETRALFHHVHQGAGSPG